MQMDVQERCARHLHASFQGTFDVLQVIEPACTEKIHNQVGPGKTNAITLDEEVLPVVVMRNVRIVFVRYMRSYTMIFLLGGA